MLSLILPSLAVLSALVPATRASNSSCEVCDEVHFFLARGNNEPYPGRQGMLVEATCDGIASCGYEDLYYSALYTDLYCQTVYDGAVAGLVQMKAYAEKCPNSKLILAGYSQGGQIAGDILGGGGGKSFNGCIQPDTPPTDPNTAPGNMISAVIIFGDVRHTANQSYDFGNGSAIDGWFPRTATQLANLEPYSKIMRDWCVSADPICAAHQPLDTYNEEAHLDYYNVDSQSAASWIQSVASLTRNDASFTTAIPTSLSGTVQNYATIGTATPSGSVKLDTTWTDFSTYSPCTSSTYALGNSTAASATVSSGASGTSTGTAGKTTSAFNGGAAKATPATSATATSQGGSTASASSSPAATGAGNTMTVASGMGVLAVIVQAFMLTR